MRGLMNSPFITNHDDTTRPRTEADTHTRLQRARGEFELVVQRRADRNIAIRCFQSGCAKLRMPRAHNGFGLETVSLNTAGGLTGGDVIKQHVQLDPGAKATVTTQAYEKIYRSTTGPAKLTTKIKLAANSNLHWLPQPLLVYEAGQLDRTTTIEADSRAEFTAVESFILGRHAMGEELTSARLRDNWSVFVNNTLVFSDRLRLEPPNQLFIENPAGLNKHKAFATMTLLRQDPEPTQDLLWNYIKTNLLIGGISRRDNLLVLRLLANDGRSLSSHLTGLIACIRASGSPRVWAL